MINDPAIGWAQRHSGVCKIKEVHCENCGSTDPEYVGDDALRESEGYTGCCNELASYGPSDCRAFHAEYDR